MSHFRPPPEAYVDPAKAAAWILKNLPQCVNGPLPLQWTQDVYSEADRWGISRSIINAALVLARQQGYQFANVGGPSPLTPGPAAPQMRAVSPSDMERSKKHTFEVLEDRFKLAQAMGDTASMEHWLGMALAALWEVAKGYARLKQAQRPVYMVEWEEFNRAVNEALNRAPTLRTHFRHLTRDDLKRLREAPTPDAQRLIRSRIVSRVRPRPVRATRR